MGIVVVRGPPIQVRKQVICEAVVPTVAVFFLSSLLSFPMLVTGILSKMRETVKKGESLSSETAARSGECVSLQKIVK
jgi:hypothetical protein